MAHTALFRLLRRTVRMAHRQNQAEGVQPSSFKACLSRRKFIKTASLAGGAAIATTALSPLQRAIGYSSSAPKIAIVGGGIAGLNAAYQLKKVGLMATVYEAKPRVGGRIHSVTSAVGQGLVNDLGGCFINTDHEDMLALVEEFGLSLFNRADDVARSQLPETAYFFDGKSYREAEIAEYLRPLAQQIADDVARLDEDFEQFAPMLDQQSVADYLDLHANKISAPVVRKLIELTIRTEYGVEPQESSALQLLYNLPTVDDSQIEPISSDEAFLIDGGNGTLIDSLAHALAGQIQLNKRLVAVQPNASGFRLTFGDASVVTADYVILALPFTVLRRVNLQVDLPTTLRRFIHEVNLGSNEKLLAGFHQKVWRQEQGFVGEAWSDLGFAAAWDDTQRQGDRSEGVLTFYLGGSEVAAAQAGSADWYGKRLVNQLDALVPGFKAAASDRFLRTRWTQDPLVGGGYTTFKPGQYTEFSEFLYIEAENPDEAQNVHVGNLVFAGEHLSDEFYGYMNGAAQTGRLAAQVVVQLVHQPA